MSEQTIAKRVLADRIAAKLNLPQGQTLQVIQCFLDEIVSELGRGNRLEFRDFGVFELVSRKPRTALNPKTLEKVPVERRTVVKFRAGRLLKGQVRDLLLDADGNPLPGSDVDPALPAAEPEA